jgi:hypothetical protein
VPYHSDNLLLSLTVQGMICNLSFWLLTALLSPLLSYHSFWPSLLLSSLLFRRLRISQKVWLPAGSRPGGEHRGRFAAFRRWRRRQMDRALRRASGKFERKRESKQAAGRRRSGSMDVATVVPDSVPYAHGAFFGAAPAMLAEEYWAETVLRHLMPDVYCEVSRRVFSPPNLLIHWAENNPVCAA